MASITLGNGRNMVGRFAQCIGKSITAAMTGGTLPRRAGMIHSRGLEGGEVGMAGIALRTAGNMVGRFSKRRRAIVAGGTLAVSAGIVRVNGCCPGNCRVVAGIALGIGADVRRRLHLGILSKIGATVTGRAQPGQPAVIHGGGAPVNEAADVACIALGDARNVIDRTRQRIGEQI